MIADANVRLVPTSGGRTGHGITTKDGAYIVGRTGAWLPDFRLEVLKDGHAPFVVALKEGGRHTCEVTLASRGGQSRGVCTPRPE
jgi:hypothetical protein